MMGAMDNLVKGAAGQAVQNMNLMFGLPERKDWNLFRCFHKKGEVEDDTDNDNEDYDQVYASLEKDPRVRNSKY